MSLTRRTLFSLALAVLGSPLPAADLAPLAAEKAASASTSAIAGADPAWRFLVKELDHVGKGDLSSTDRTAASVEGTDPLPIIEEYATALSELGVQLWIVPVPAKATIYPEKLDASLSSPDPSALSAFLARIAETPADVIDLGPLFVEHRVSHPDEALYCATDSHWSPRGAELAAAAVAEALQSATGLSDGPSTDFRVGEATDLSFHGDLLTDEEKSSLDPEVLPMRPVDPATDGASPLLVIGDSHCQVFRKGGSMHATGAGFIDHLAAGLGMPVSEVSSQASGADQPRADIARRTVKEPDFWKQHPVVVWLFTEREFTQGRWRTIPAQVVRK